MEMNDIIQAVSTLGFPIVMCAVLFWHMVKIQETHKEEMNALKDSLNQNTLALTELRDVIKYLNGGGKENAQRG